jgi:hypothetical protein
VIYYDIRETRSQSFTQFIDDKSPPSTIPPAPDCAHYHRPARLDGDRLAQYRRCAFGSKVSEYIEGPRTPGGPNVPWKVNPPNLPMFQKGTAPFIGDYVDITAAPNFLIDQCRGTVDLQHAASTTPPVFHAAWTDNRDVRVPLDWI